MINVYFYEPIGGILKYFITSELNNILFYNETYRANHNLFKLSIFLYGSLTKILLSYYYLGLNIFLLKSEKKFIFRKMSYKQNPGNKKTIKCMKILCIGRKPGS